MCACVYIHTHAQEILFMTHLLFCVIGDCIIVSTSMAVNVRKFNDLNRSQQN